MQASAAEASQMTGPKNTGCCVAIAAATAAGHPACGGQRASRIAR